MEVSRPDSYPIPGSIIPESRPVCRRLNTCACAKLHLVSDSGLRRVGWDETHGLLPDRAGQSVQSPFAMWILYAMARLATQCVSVGDGAAVESRSGGEAFVALVKATDLRNRNHRATVRRLDGASIRAVFVEREMGP